jgi:4-aminobutyrate aminotransferase-like enzyme
VADLRREFLNPAIFAYYKTPLMIVEGQMQYLYDETGRRYLDGFGGIVTVSVGHCHPKVIEAVQRQNETLQHTTTIYLNPAIAQYARDLAARLGRRAAARHLLVTRTRDRECAQASTYTRALTSSIARARARRLLRT